MESGTQTVEAIGLASWPIEVRALVGSMRLQKSYVERERRAQSRECFEIRTTLWVKDNLSQVQRETVYTRDYGRRSISFVCSGFFKAGQSVSIELPSESGPVQQVQGHIRRCRQIQEGWFDCLMEIQSVAKVGR